MAFTLTNQELGQRTDSHKMLTPTWRRVRSGPLPRTLLPWTARWVRRWTPRSPPTPQALQIYASQIQAEAGGHVDLPIYLSIQVFIHLSLSLPLRASLGSPGFGGGGGGGGGGRRGPHSKPNVPKSPCQTPKTEQMAQLRILPSTISVMETAELRSPHPCLFAGGSSSLCISSSASSINISRLDFQPAGLMHSQLRTESEPLEFGQRTLALSSGAKGLLQKYLREASREATLRSVIFGHAACSSSMPCSAYLSFS